MGIQDCFICRKHKGEVVVPGGCIYEDEFVYVGHIGSKEELIYLGYLIIDLKRHVPGLGDMTEDESKTIGYVLNQMGKALKRVENAEHLYCYVQGDAFPHFHIHLIPRYPNTPQEYWDPMKLKNWENAKGGVKEIEELCNRLRNYLRESNV
jgi:histidine triad (HIT) family protein